MKKEVRIWVNLMYCNLHPRDKTRMGKGIHYLHQLVKELDIPHAMKGVNIYIEKEDGVILTTRPPILLFWGTRTDQFTAIYLDSQRKYKRAEMLEYIDAVWLKDRQERYYYEVWLRKWKLKSKQRC